jgi:hypothetical protein
MFEQLARKIDSYSCRVLLGRTVRRRSVQLWRRDNYRLPEEEYEPIAYQEALASLRSEGVDATSLSQIKEWSERFLFNNNLP